MIGKTLTMMWTGVDSDGPNSGLQSGATISKNLPKKCLIPFDVFGGSRLNKI